MYRNILLFTICILSTFSFFLFPRVTNAQTDTSQQSVEGAATMGVANMVAVKSKDVPNGSIVSSSTGGAILSSTPYDPQVLGVVSRDAGIVLSTTDEANSVPVISEGTVYLLVSSQQGNIKKGDILATSTIPGVAVFAKDSGYVLGYALEDYSSSDPKQVGKIAANLNLHYFNSKPTLAGSLTDVFKIALLPTKVSASPIFKYSVAAIVVLGSFALGFLSFGRTAAKGIEALGRNPSASAVIHLGIIFNVAIVISIILAGLGVAFMILRL